MATRPGNKEDRSFHMPPRRHTAQGNIRRAGFEFEFAGLTVEQAAGVVTDLFGGTQTAENAFRQTVSGSRYGDFRIEFDSIFLKDKRYLSYLQQLGIDIAEFIDELALEDFLTQTAALLVPIEIITPPVPITELDQIEQLRHALYAHQAQGTKASFFYAFGLHINTEAPDLDAATLRNYLRAFLLLQDWIKEETQVDFTRRITPYINPFPEAFINLALDLDYDPNLDQLLADYLHYNPTRNRPLDLTPILACLDKDQVMQSVQEPDLIKKRPAFHFRLPNCLIDQPSWTIAQEWNLWVTVETLAADPDKIAAMSADYLATRDPLVEFFLKDWPQRVRRWLA